jgi:hypothetical protein
MEKQTLGEIHAALEEQGIPISERRVADYIEEYQILLKCAHGARLEAYRSQISENGGIVLAIDGAQPEKGKETLYLFRDALTGARLHAVSLWHHDTDSLIAEMEEVQAVLDRLDVAVLGVISDDQAAIRCGVAQVWPDVPHQRCQLHFLKAVQKPIYDADRSLAKELKKGAVASAPSSARWQI